jgi:phage terminase large subunit
MAKPIEFQFVDNYPQDYHSKHFFPLLYDQSRYLVLKGGAGSGKSRFAGQKIIHRIIYENGANHRILLIRKTQPALRRSSFALIGDTIKTWNLSKLFTQNKTEMSYECKNGNQIISAGLDDPEKLKSIERVTGIWIEEATEITHDDFMQIDLRLRGELETYKQIILSFNPIDINSWLNKTFFMQSREGATVDSSTVDDNEFIDTEYKKILDNLQNEDSTYYNIYRLGLWGVLKNLIYGNNVIMQAKDWPQSFDETIYGLDFGYNNPTALLEINYKDQSPYERELMYDKELTNQDVIEKLEVLIPDKRKAIYADCAEPARIEEIQRAGFNIHPADKSVKDGIDYCKRLKIMMHAESTNLIHENGQYKYKEDKNGNVIDDPVKFSDHLMDCRRYGHYSHRITGPPASMTSRDPEPTIKRHRW